MSLFKYFKPRGNTSTNVCEEASSIVSTHAASGVLGISEKEAKKVVEELSSIASQNLGKQNKQTRVQYEEKDKIRICRYAIFHGNRQAATHFAKEFPKLDESCVRHWASKY